MSHLLGGEVVFTGIIEFYVPYHETEVWRRKSGANIIFLTGTGVKMIIMVTIVMIRKWFGVPAAASWNWPPHLGQSATALSR